MQIVSVMHVLVFAEIRCHLTHFCVELDVYMFLLPKQNSMLEKKTSKFINNGEDTVHHTQNSELMKRRRSKEKHK